MTKALLPVVGLVRSILISVPLAPGYILTLVVPSLNFSLSKEVLSNSSPFLVRKPLSLPSVFIYLLIGRAAIGSSFLSFLIKSLSSLTNGMSSIDLLFLACHNDTRFFTDSTVSFGNFVANSFILGVGIKHTGLLIY